VISDVQVLERLAVSAAHALEEFVIAGKGAVIGLGALVARGVPSAR
jgi:hypothetical protein